MAAARQAIAVAAVPTAGTLLVILLAANSWQQIQKRMRSVDARVQAVNWLQQHTLPGDRILALRELEILPSEWKRAGAKSLIVPWFEASAALQRESFDYIIAGEPDLQLATDPAGWAAYRSRWQALVSPLTTAADFGTVPCSMCPTFGGRMTSAS